jgi:hypothetical protein
MIKLSELLQEESPKQALISDINNIPDHQVIKILQLLNIEGVINRLPDNQIPNLASGLKNVASLIEKYYK